MRSGSQTLVLFFKHSHSSPSDFPQSRLTLFTSVIILFLSGAITQDFNVAYWTRIPFVSFQGRIVRNLG